MFDHGEARKHIQEDFKSAIEGRVATRSTDLSDRSGRPHHIEYTLKPVFDERGQAFNRGLDAPILSCLHAILYKGLDPRAGVIALMTRDLRSEA